MTDAVNVEAGGSSLRLDFEDSRWEVVLPKGWRSSPAEEEDLWCWELDALALCRVRLRRHPHVAVEIDVTSVAADVVTLRTPVVELTSHGWQVPWFAGSAGEVLHVLPTKNVLWAQVRGTCAPTTDGFTVLPDPLLLRPGTGGSAVWRRHTLPAGEVPPEPAWLPTRRHLPSGEALEVEHGDAALSATSLAISTTGDGSRVQGAVGLHPLAFHDARGITLVEVGWYTALAELAGTCLALPGTEAGVTAWLLVNGVDGHWDVDHLDVVLGRALEAPTLWGVLAGMRVQVLTDLPVGSDVAAAAQALWQLEEDVEARRLLVAHALLAGWEPAVVRQWRATSADDNPPTLDSVLGAIGCGRITTAPVTHGGRDVMRARMWVASQGESAVVAHWERAVDTARARLLCSLSTRPDPVDVAWLVAEALIG